MQILKDGREFKKMKNIIKIALEIFKIELLVEEEVEDIIMLIERIL